MMTAASRPIRDVDDLRGRPVLVIGLARSGLAAARFLCDAGAVVTVYDRREASDLAESVAALGPRPVQVALAVPEGEARALVADAELIVTSPSISPDFPTTDPWLREELAAAVARGAELVSEVDLFLRLTPARVIAVTGTKGKTTTATLLAAMLEQAGIPHVLGGNVGTPLIERSLELDRETWAVLELSELQLPTISRGADVAVYTNVMADHLDRHGSVEAYRAVKARLARLAPPSGLIVLNRDDPGCRELADTVHPAPGSVRWYGLGADASADAGAALDAGVADGWITLDGRRLLPVAEVPLPGAHMLANVVGAALGAALAGADPGSIASAIRGFRGVPHRLEAVAERNGVRYVNDSQATIPEAAIAGLEAFDAPVVLIAGGKDKGLDYAAFADAIAGRCRAAVLFGETAAELARLVADRVPVVRTSSMAEAVEAAAAAAQPGDVVLLAPAAASFDMFDDYAARGDAFRQAVAALAPGAAR